MENKELEELVKKRINELGEHWDAIQFMATRLGKNGETEDMFWGVGNQYAREGLIMELVKRDWAEEAAHWIKKKQDAE